MIPLLGGLYLGWALGANDASNVFGTAVATRIVRFRDAAILCGIAVILGALLEGQAGMHTLRGLADQTHVTLTIVMVSAAITVTLMTIFRLPISTSQALVGAIAGVGLATDSMQWSGLGKVVICWVSAPIGAFLISAVLMKVLSWLFRRIPMGLLTRARLLHAGLVLVGAYGAYALGANNVANVTGLLSGVIPGLDDRELCLLGGVAIAIGVVTYSKRVMMSVGGQIFPLEAFTAFCAVTGMSITVHVLAILGVPVSTSQAIVGAILGVGALRGWQNIRFLMLRHIAFGWILTPIIALILSAAAFAVFT